MVDFSASYVSLPEGILDWRSAPRTQDGLLPPPSEPRKKTLLLSIESWLGSKRNPCNGL